MMIRSNQKTIYCISQYDKNGKYIEYNVGDKIVLKINNQVVSGEIHKIGRKKMTLKTGVELIYRPRGEGTYSQLLNWKEINIEDIEKIAKYPDTYQRLGTKYIK